MKPGEATGVYGLWGSGRTNLLVSLFGARKKIRGELIFKDRAIEVRNPLHAMDLGISFVTSIRTDQSPFGSMSATENLLMPHFGQRVLPSKMRNIGEETRLFEKIANKLLVHPPNPKLAASRFIGGNAQKLVLGRWLHEDNIAGKLILLDELTQGVDVSARAQIYRTLRTALQHGVGVIFPLADPDEINTLADRVLILGYGRQVAFIDNPKSQSELVAMAHRTAPRLCHRGGTMTEKHSQMTADVNVANAGAASPDTSQTRTFDWVEFLISAALPIAVILLGLFFYINAPVFFTWRNAINISIQIAALMTIALPSAMLLMAGKVDLSVGSMLALCGVVAGISFETLPVPGTVLLMVCVGLVAG